MPMSVFNEQPIRRVRVLGYVVDNDHLFRIVEYEYDNPAAPGESRIRQLETELIPRSQLSALNIEEQADLHRKSQSVCGQLYGKLFDELCKNRFTEKGK